MRYHLFLQYGWFLQNLGKDFIRTNMHTNVGILASAALYIHTCYTYIVFCIGGQSAVKAAFIQEPIAVRVVN